jgi:hypothetical protein
MSKWPINLGVLLPVGTAIGIMRWWDTFHVLPALLLALAAIAIVRRKPVTLVRRQSTSVAGRSSPLKRNSRGLRFALFMGLVVTTAVFGWHIVLLKVPVLHAAYLDRDRPFFEAKLNRLEAAGEWHAAATVAVSRLGEPLSVKWQTTLASRAYIDLLQAAAAASSADQERVLAGAVALAEQYGLVSSLGAAISERNRLRGELARADEQRQELAANASGTAAQLDKQRVRVTELANRYLESLLGLGEAISDPNLRSATYDAGERLAQEYGLSTSKISLSRAQLARQITERRPAALPPATTADVVSVSAEHSPPVVLIEVAVRQPNGQALMGLTAKDFLVTNKNGVLTVLADAQTHTDPPGIQATILIDASASTQGSAIQAAQRGAVSIVEQLPMAGRVYAFGSKVSALTSWTAERSELAQAIVSVRPAGQTALVQALDQATRDVASRAGLRTIILFTDGRDTVGGPPLEAILARCREHWITVHVVALQTPELDVGFLRQVAEGTGGSYYSAESVNALPQRFQQLRSSFRQPVYRLVVPVTNAGLDSFSVRVGGINAAETQWTRNK